MNRRALAAITTVVAAAIVVVAVVAYFKGPTHGSVQTASQSPIVGKAQVGKTAPQFEVIPRPPGLAPPPAVNSFGRIAP